MHRDDHDHKGRRTRLSHHCIESPAMIPDDHAEAAAALLSLSEQPRLAQARQSEQQWWNDAPSRSVSAFHMAALDALGMPQEVPTASVQSVERACQQYRCVGTPHHI